MLYNEKGNVFTNVLLIIIIILLIILAFPIVSDYIHQSEEKDKVNEGISFECMSAIAGIRSAYRVHFNTHSSFNSYSVDLAINDCKLSNSVKTKWVFEVLGNPPTKYIATSTSTNPIGSGETIYYDVKSALHGGYGID